MNCFVLTLERNFSRRRESNWEAVELVSNYAEFRNLTYLNFHLRIKLSWFFRWQVWSHCYLWNWHLGKQQCPLSVTPFWSLLNACGVAKSTFSNGGCLFSIEQIFFWCTWFCNFRILVSLTVRNFQNFHVSLCNSNLACIPSCSTRDQYKV